MVQDAVQKFCGEGTPCIAAATVPLFMADFERAVEDVGSHPCILMYILFNEGDCVGLFNASETLRWAEALDGAASPHGAQGMGRLIDLNSGGPANDLRLGDAFDVHSYPYPGTPLPSATQMAMVGEWSGMGWFPGPGHEWDEGACYTGGPRPPGEPSAAALASAYAAALDALTTGAPWVAAAIATQATDVEAECDGLRNYDRTPSSTPPRLRSWPPPMRGSLQRDSRGRGRERCERRGEEEGRSSRSHAHAPPAPLSWWTRAGRAARSA